MLVPQICTPGLGSKRAVTVRVRIRIRVRIRVRVGVRVRVRVRIRVRISVRVMMRSHAGKVTTHSEAQQGFTEQPVVAILYPRFLKY